jgi:hypothetical protein
MKKQSLVTALAPPTATCAAVWSPPSIATSTVASSTRVSPASAAPIAGTNSWRPAPASCGAFARATSRRIHSAPLLLPSAGWLREKAILRTWLSLLKHGIASCSRRHIGFEASTLGLRSSELSPFATSPAWGEALRVCLLDVSRTPGGRTD